MATRVLRTAAWLCALLGPHAFAQTQAQITGTISDSTGAVAVGATVAARNVDTGVRVETHSNQNGVYLLPFLTPGRYELTSELAGFKKFMRSGIVLETGSTITIDVGLQMGEVSESIVVESTVPLIESESSSVGQLIERSNVANMPVESRRSGALVRLMGNVVYREEAQGEAIPRFTMAGGRPTSQMWSLDGGVVQAVTLGNPILVLNPPAESLQEFKAEASNYSAEFGHSGGGTILMTTRSGTNTFHGAAYEFLRNDKLDARSFFSPGKAPLRYNIFGASLGGPVQRDKMFFFFNYEGTRRRDGITISNTTVPHPAEIKGDFSARTDLTLLDPLTKTPFARNVIPASRIVAQGLALAQSYPTPNVFSDPTRAPFNNFVKNVSDSTNQDFYTMRVDRTLGYSNRVYGRFSYVDVTDIAAAALPEAYADSRAQTKDNSSLSVVGSWFSNIRPTLINEMRFSHGNKTGLVLAAGTGSGKNGELGIKGVDPDRFPRVTVAGLTTLGSSQQRRNQSPQRTEQIVDTLTWVKGTHQIKTGVEFRYSRNFDDNTGTTGGLFAFSDRATNSGLAALLLGWVNNASVTGTRALDTRSDYYGAFMQDDWKVSRRVTLNLGLRWEMDTPRWERNNRQSGFDPDAINPVAGIRGAMTFAGLEGVSKYAHDFDKNNFGPRVGLAWRATDTLAVRAGYGISYNGLYNAGIGAAMSNGFGISGSFTSPDGGFTPAFLLQAGMPAFVDEPIGPGWGAVKPPAKPRATAFFMQKDQVAGYAQQWNLTLQKSIAGNMLLEASYVANVGHKLAGPNIDTNMVPLVNGLGPATQNQQMRPFPHYNNVTMVSPAWGNSSYHSMNLKAEKRYSSGFNFLMNFTWSKFLDDVAGNAQLGGNEGSGYTHLELRRLDKSYSGSDIRLRYVGSTVYELPFGKGRRWDIRNPLVNAVLGGWGVSVIGELHSGSPWGAIEQTNRTNTYSSAQRANLLYDPTISGNRSRSEMLQRYFDISAFATPGVGVFGNAARVNGFGPGFFGLDTSVFKRWAVTERMGLQFRGDCFNLPNFPNFGLPDAVHGAGGFGSISSIAPGTSGRLIQLSMRLEF